MTFQGNVQTISTGGSITLSSPSGIVVDPAGDIFIADTVSGSGRIVEVNAQGTASVLTISGLSPALGSLSGIAIDGGGNLYITDPGHNRVVKVSPSGAGSTLSVGSVNLTTPQGIALDQSGDIFIADTGNNRIVEVPSTGTPAAPRSMFPRDPLRSTLRRGWPWAHPGSSISPIPQTSCRDGCIGKHHGRGLQHR